LDASVAAKWFLPSTGEALVQEALGVREALDNGGVELTVPDLFWLELGNAVSTAARRKRITQPLAEEAMDSISDLQIPTAPSRPLINDAFAIASASQCTVYDAVYVALAVAVEAPMLTADERLLNALPAHFPVRWLGSYI
jgi:predicted nucleic acid-binding protein